MGIHICVIDKDSGKELPQSEWDYLREVNDKKFPAFIDYSKVTSKGACFKPNNIDEICEKIKSTDWDNKERYLKLMSLINKGHWICFDF